MEPEQPSPDPKHESAPEEAHLPPPTLWPIGFAIGVVVVLVGLVINPELISSIGGVIVVVFGFLWARDATAELRGAAPPVEPERREAPAEEGHDVTLVPVTAETVTRSRFLEGATLGLGGVIGGLITVPVAGFAILPGFLRQKGHKVDLGPISDFTPSQWFITTFVVDPAQGEVSRRTAFIRNNGPVTDPKTKKPVQSFSIISNRCVHLGCPTQANGPTGSILGMPTVTEHTANGHVVLDPVVPAGYGCPCHGSQYDVEGNRTAGPAPHALDRYEYEIDNGRLILLSTYSVSHVVGAGAQAKIYKYGYSSPGNEVNGPEQWLWPLQPPHH